MDQAFKDRGLVSLELSGPIWDRFFMAAPLVLVGTRESDGSDDVAPKHMVTALSWENHVGFVCAPTHATYQNARRTGEFALSFPRPDQVLLASLASAPRCEDDEKPALANVETFRGHVVGAPLVAGSYLHLECKLHGVWGGFGPNSMIAGEVVAAHVADGSYRRHDRDDSEILREEPLLVYLPPGRYAQISESVAFPFHEGMVR